MAAVKAIMKCFERLVLYHIKASLPSTSDEHLFAYRMNRTTEDAIDLALHTILSHLEKHGNYIRMLFIDYSSAFNTIILDILVSKLTNLGLPRLTCHWIKDFPINHSQSEENDLYILTKMLQQRWKYNF